VKKSEKKSKKYYDDLWTKALKTGVCPVEGCDITKSVCKHLNKHLNYSQSYYASDALDMAYNSMSEALDVAVNGKESEAWALFKRLRKYLAPLNHARDRRFKSSKKQAPRIICDGSKFLTPDQILILIRTFVYNMSTRQIEKDMGWSNHMLVTRRLNKALEVLKNYGVDMRGLK
jgi:hypothetical protein